MPSRALLIVAFVVYLVLLTWIILWKLQPPFVGGGALRAIKLVPYVPAGGAKGSSPLEVAVNIILFIPFGAFLGLHAPSWQWWKHLAVFAGVSVAFEATQYILAIGTSDITDVIDNTLGGLAGLGMLALARRGFRARADGVAGRVLLVGTVIFLLAVGLFVLSPLQLHDHRR